MPLFIASHKPTRTPAADFYRGIALGGAVLDGFPHTDGSGQNIAALNRQYCELTATYWIWKNTQDDLVGLCHYRRYFNLVPNNHQQRHMLELEFDANIEGILDNPLQLELMQQALQHYDIILPFAVHEPGPIGHSYSAAHGHVEWNAMLGALDLLYGPRQHALRLERRFYQCNMFVCRREVFDRYASQLFFAIDQVYQQVGPLPEVPGARYQPFRYPGYLAERFMSAFVNANRLRVYEAQMLLMKNL